MPEQVFQGDEDDRYEVSIVHGKSTLEYSLSNNEPAFPLTFWITLLLWTIVVGVNFESAKFSFCRLFGLAISGSW